MKRNMDILIFDMDGVLVDVSNSYRETIAQTIRIYFDECFGIKLKPITKADISLFKSAGGFNNDWNLTSGFLLYLLSLSGIPSSPKKKKFSNIHDTVSYLKDKFSKCKPDIVRLPHKKDLYDFLKMVKSFGGGLNGIQRALEDSWDGWVYRMGDLDKENLVKRIFQEVYLGRQFISYYHLEPLFYKGKGLYLNERLLIPRRILSLLRKRLRMGIASGRPRFEAEVALKRFGLLSYFDSMVTLDECLEEEGRIFRSAGKRVKRSKPHPYSILRAIQEIGLPNPRCGYIGDVVDDMVAANAAKKEFRLLAIGFLSDRSKLKAFKESLFRAGADLILRSPDELLHLNN